jgi:hypothetical protein
VGWKESFFWREEGEGGTEGGVRENGDPSRKGEIETNTGKSYANIILMCIYIYISFISKQRKIRMFLTAGKNYRRMFQQREC